MNFYCDVMFISRTFCASDEIYFLFAGEALPSADKELVTPVTSERSAGRRRRERSEPADQRSLSWLVQSQPLGRANPLGVSERQRLARAQSALVGRHVRRRHWVNFVETECSVKCKQKRGGGHRPHVKLPPIIAWIVQRKAMILLVFLFNKGI